MRIVICGAALILFLVTSALAADTAWVRTYNGIDNGGDEAVAVTSDDSGNVYICGWSYSATTGEDWVTIKYRLDGSVAWSNRYSGAGNHSDRPSGLVVDSVGNVYVAGRSVVDTTNDFYTIKYSAAGVLQWGRSYHAVADKDDYATAIALYPGGVVVAGASTGSAIGYDYALLKYDGAGTTVWTRRFDGSVPGALASDDIPAALTVDASGYAVVTGASKDSLGIDDYLTIRYSPIGNISWSRRYNGPISGTDRAVDVITDTAGNVIVTGSSAGIGSASDYLTIKYSTTGTATWTKRYAGPGNCGQGTCEDNATAVALSPSGNIYVTGFSNQALSVTGNDFDIATVAYNSSGAQLWVRNYNGAANLNDWGEDVAVAPSGNVFVAGIIHGPQPFVDVMVLGYTPSGDSVAQEQYDSEVHLDDRATALVVDDSGNVIVTGSTETPSSAQNFLTIKYRAATLTCCHGTTGNVDTKGIVDLSDLTILIQFLTVPGTKLPCQESANVNNRGVVDLSDLTLLVGFLVGTDPVLPSCP